MTNNDNKIEDYIVKFKGLIFYCIKKDIISIIIQGYNKNVIPL